MAKQPAARVTKRTSPRVTRSKSKMANAAGRNGNLSQVMDEALETMYDHRDASESILVDIDGDEGNAFENIVAEDEGAATEEDSDGGVLVPLPLESAWDGQGKGKGKVVLRPVREKLQVFRLFDLPTEIRLEIYKACLTRPYNILLSKAEKPAQVLTEEGPWHDVVEDDGILDHAPMPLGPTLVPRPPSTRSNSTTRARRRGGVGTAVARHRSNARPLRAYPVNTRSTLRAARPKTTPLPDRRPRMEDPLITNILRTNKTVYKEARDVLYGENIFSLDLSTAVTSLAALHQRSRGRIRHIELEIPTYTEIVESFSETVRLSLRYCSGLRKLVVNTPFSLPDADGQSGNAMVYANGFDILRWLPRGCEVVLHGTRNPEIDVLVERHMGLARTQDQVSYETPYARCDPEEYVRYNRWRRENERVLLHSQDSSRGGSYLS